MCVTRCDARVVVVEVDRAGGVRFRCLLVLRRIQFGYHICCGPRRAGYSASSAAHASVRVQ